MRRAQAQKPTSSAPYYPSFEGTWLEVEKALSTWRLCAENDNREIDRDQSCSVECGANGDCIFGAGSSAGGGRRPRLLRPVLPERQLPELRPRQSALPRQLCPGRTAE